MSGQQPVQNAPAVQQHNPFLGGRAQHVNAGTVDIEQSRAVAEAQGKLLIAKRFPRNEAAAFDTVMASCKRITLAAQATYSYPRGGQTISGPSIRLAEELARAWGNIDFGIRELSQKDGVSEMQAYAWDLQTNVISTQNFTVKHERHTTNGVKRLTDPRDIYEMTANQAGRRLRARILAILPPDLVEGALEQCRATLVAANNPGDKKKVDGLLVAFGKFGVTAQHIEARLGHPIASLTAEEYADLINIGNSLKDNMSQPSDWFTGMADTSGNDAVNALNDKLKAGAQTSGQVDGAPASDSSAHGAGNGKARRTPRQPAQPAAAPPAQETSANEANEELV